MGEPLTLILSPKGRGDGLGMRLAGRLTLQVGRPDRGQRPRLQGIRGERRS